MHLCPDFRASEQVANEKKLAVFPAEFPNPSPSLLEITGSSTVSGGSGTCRSTARQQSRLSLKIRAVLVPRCRKATPLISAGRPTPMVAGEERTWLLLVCLKPCTTKFPIARLALSLSLSLSRERLPCIKSIAEPGTSSSEPRRVVRHGCLRAAG